MYKYLIVLAFLIPSISWSQELNCTVSITYTGSTTQSRTNEIYTNLKLSIEEFMNGQQWTNHKFASNEKIECSISLNVTKESGTDGYICEAIISSSRPVFNSSYTTTVLNLKDPSFNFIYQDGAPILYNKGTSTSELSNLLAYYAYLILGLDYDTFQKDGGSEWYREADDITTLTEWSRDGDYSRINLIKLIQRPDHASLRRFNYEYHRLGLDLMEKEMNKAKTKLNQTLKQLKKMNDDVPGSIWLKILFVCKRNEIANILKELPDDKKTASIDMLNKVDINNRGVYNKAKK